MYKRQMNIEYFFNPLNGTFPNGEQIIKYIQMSIRKRASECLHILLCVVCMDENQQVMPSLPYFICKLEFHMIIDFVTFQFFLFINSFIRQIFICIQEMLYFAFKYFIDVYFYNF